VKKVQIGPFDVMRETLAALSTHGALLMPSAEPVNAMTIGWGQIGHVWAMPVFTVYVRPTRFTHELLEKSRYFSVNLPPEVMSDVTMMMGSRSGRDVDKIAEAGLTIQLGRLLDVPTILECPIHYECRIVHKSPVEPAMLADDLVGSLYRDAQYHTVYWGEIVGVFKRA